MCPTHQISCVQEMCMKCHLSCFLIFSFMRESTYRKCEGNVLEMSCILATGNAPEISCILVQEMCLKFCPILHQEKSRKCQNFLVQEMSMPCKISAHFMGFPCPGNLGFLPVLRPSFINSSTKCDQIYENQSKWLRQTSTIR